MKKIFSTFKLVITLLFFFFISACTSDKKVDGTTTTVEEAPIIVRSRLRGEPDKLSPVLTTKSPSLQVVNIVFPMLLTYDPETYVLSPVLAKSRPEKEFLTEGPYKGGVAYTYELHEEAVWDDGKPVLASDYIFSLKATFNPLVKANAYQGILNAIKDVKIDPTNPKRFTVYCTQTFRTEFVSGFYVYPEHVYDPEKLMQNFEFTDLTDPAKNKTLTEDATIKKFADFFNAQGSPGTLIESCGPYKVVEWETGQRIVLEKKKDWWGDKLADKFPMLKVYPEEIIFSPIPDDMATVTAIKGGQIDAAGKINAGMFKEFQESEAGAKFEFNAAPTLLYNYMGLNGKRPFFTDKRVRRAMAHLTDVKGLIESIQLGMATPISSPFPMNADYVDQNLPLIPFDVEKAKALLAEAGWTDTDGDGIIDKVIKGKKIPFQIKIVITDSEVSKNNVATLQEDAIKAGVSIEPDIVTASQLFRERLPQRDFDAYLLASGFDLDLTDPIQFWHTSSDTPSGGNRFGFGNSETDAIIDELRQTNDDVRRKELYFQLQKIIYDEQPIVLLNAPKDRIIISKEFKNAKPTLRTPGYTESLFH